MSQRISACLFALVSILFVPIGQSSAAGVTLPGETDKLQAECEAQPFIQFGFGTERLSIDARILSYPIFSRIAGKYGADACPVLVDGIDIAIETASPSLRFQIAPHKFPTWVFIQNFAPGLGDDTRLDVTKMGRQWEGEDGARIRDVTLARQTLYHSDTKRIYRITYPATDDPWTEALSRIVCTGRQAGVPGRICHAHYNISGDLFFGYEFFQPSHLWDLPTEGEHNGMTEPEALLEIDSLMRKWLSSLRSAP